MAEGSIIAWTDNTFNPWMGCTKVSPGCTNCYAETLTTNRMGKRLWGPLGNRQVTSKDNWKKPFRWNRCAERTGTHSKVFCGSLCDVFEDHPTANETRPHLWEVIRSTPHLEWQVLTKRSDRIKNNLPADWAHGYPNVWLGVSVEDQEYADLRIPDLQAVPAKIRFLSIEPMLGPVDVSSHLGPDRINWVIVGGESGSHYRPMDHAWARSVRDQCREASVPFFFKQSSTGRTEKGTELVEEDGSRAVVREFPDF